MKYINKVFVPHYFQTPVIAGLSDHEECCSFSSGAVCGNTPSLDCISMGVPTLLVLGL